MQEIGDGSFKDENRMLTITENYKATLLPFEIRHNKMYNGFFFILKQINKQNAFPAIKVNF